MSHLRPQYQGTQYHSTHTRTKLRRFIMLVMLCFSFQMLAVNLKWRSYIPVKINFWGPWFCSKNWTIQSDLSTNCCLVPVLVIIFICNCNCNYISLNQWFTDLTKIYLHPCS
jgi:hypothetical protein